MSVHWQWHRQWGLLQRMCLHAVSSTPVPVPGVADDTTRNLMHALMVVCVHQLTSNIMPCQNSMVQTYPMYVQGADPNARALGGLTPLHVALLTGHNVRMYAVLQHLLDKVRAHRCPACDLSCNAAVWCRCACWHVFLCMHLCVQFAVFIMLHSWHCWYGSALMQGQAR